MYKYGVFEEYFGKFDAENIICVTETQDNAVMICKLFTDYRQKNGRVCFAYNYRIVDENPDYCRYVVSLNGDVICAVDDVSGASRICSFFDDKEASYNKIADDYIDFLDDIDYWH